MDRQFTIRNVARCVSQNGFNHPLESWSASDWGIAMLGEFGEAANIIKKLNRYRDSIPGNKETVDALKAKLKSELADGYIYLDLLCAREGIDLRQAVLETFEKKSKEIGYVETTCEYCKQPNSVCHCGAR